MKEQSKKKLRIRDPIHNIIEFDDKDECECKLWDIIQTKEFQRLRRIKQLGFSEYVYPGATHTRFSHSLGVFHIAKTLITIIEKIKEKRDATPRYPVLAASILHDIGHGPFSHAFEDFGKKLNKCLNLKNALPFTSHEKISSAIITETHISKILNKIDDGFADKVAKVIGDPGPQRIYGAIVSSQFDADRLDYMQRDRLMTGTKIAGIDFSWMLNNLVIDEVPYDTEGDELITRETFAINAKAIHAAESYLLALFQLYPTVYFHKATRGIEKLFTELLFRLFTLVREENIAATNLPKNHPLILFMVLICQHIEKLQEAEKEEREYKEKFSLTPILALDDTVVLGALSMIAEAEDSILKNLANRIYLRDHYTCFDVGEYLNSKYDSTTIMSETDFFQTIRQKITLGLDSKKTQSIEDCKSIFEDISKNIDDFLIQRTDKREKIRKVIGHITKEIDQWKNEQIENKTGEDIKILQDESNREAYNSFNPKKGSLNQIRIKYPHSEESQDIENCSPTVKAIPSFEFYRIYYAEETNGGAKRIIDDIIKKVIKEYM